jgi:hypothetical protein
MGGKKYWDVMYTLRPITSLQMPNIELHRLGIEPRPPLIECRRSTIELWNLYIIWVCLRPSTSLQIPNIELHRPGIESGTPLIECGRSTIELWNLYIIWVC